jgi:GNAT superfamily N-acetyltransferase
MKLLERKNYPLASERLPEIELNTLFAQAVLNLKVEGSIYVNDIGNPETFYVSHPYGMSLLFGTTEDKEFNSRLKDYLLDQSRSRKKREWLQVHPASWNDILCDLVNGRVTDYTEYSEEMEESAILMRVRQCRPSHLIRWERVNFEFRNLPGGDNVEVDRGYRLSQIDPRSYDLISGSVIPANFWKDKETFLSSGIGFILTEDENMVSASFSSFFEGNELELGVETSEPYQGKGFGRFVCAELINYCLRNDLEPVWSCNRMNIGSYCLARSLGFEETLCLPYYELVREAG